MNQSNTPLPERQFRTQLLLRELGYSVSNIRSDSSVWSADFRDNGDFSGTATIDAAQRFLELSCTFIFDAREQDFLRDRMDRFMQICYQFGCYFTIVAESPEIRISLFSKLYFSGLQYYALEETCSDLKNAVEALRKLFDARWQVA